MKKYFTVFFFALLIFSLPVWPQVTGCLENENCSQKGQNVTQFQFWIQGPLTKNIGFFGWALTSKMWSEIYPGLYWQPTSWLQIGIGAGIEQSQSKARIGEFLWIGKGRFSLVAYTEHSGSGFWYRTYAMYQINQRFQIGMMSQHKLGIGPKVEAVIIKPFSLWVAVLSFGQNPKTTAFGGLKLGF